MSRMCVHSELYFGSTGWNLPKYL